ncbi:hypothetical protein ACWOFR_11430 [Carnobacterium gallinarum]|uniref:hypothetical protein n=1 Tax=Carnobacterium gallinarum TaxID=2749 RepID=UPI00055323B0|nr:hypothetical protein [Carnobacterium gallinarum]
MSFIDVYWQDKDVYCVTFEAQIKYGKEYLLKEFTRILIFPYGLTEEKVREKIFLNLENIIEIKSVDLMFEGISLNS